MKVKFLKSFKIITASGLVEYKAGDVVDLYAGGDCVTALEGGFAEPVKASEAEEKAVQPKKGLKKATK